jgi:uncharacterized tellurite resistance protein B-like protein
MQRILARANQINRNVMLKKLKDFFNEEFQPNKSQDPEKALHRACAMLLMEVSRADFDFSQNEKDKVAKLLKSLFDLSDTSLAELLEYSEAKSEENTAVHPFTSLINEHYDYNKRVNLVALMWKVAYADGNLDKYEDSVIRKVADLLYIRHSDFIRTKLEGEQG